MEDSFEPKKLALLRVLQLLAKHSDPDHPIKHGELVTSPEELRHRIIKNLQTATVKYEKD